MGGGQVQVQEEDKVHGGAQDGVQDQQVGRDLEGDQGVRRGLGNLQGEEGREQKRGTKRGLIEGGQDARGGLAHGGGNVPVKKEEIYDQSDPSVRAGVVPMCKFKWGEGRGQGLGGHVQGEESMPGGEGGPTTTASKVSSINIEGDKVMMRETGPGGGEGLHQMLMSMSAEMGMISLISLYGEVKDFMGS